MNDDLQDLLNFVSTVWTNIQLDLDNEEIVSERVFSLREEAGDTLERYGIHPELHYLNFLVNDRPGTFVILDEEDDIKVETDTAEQCVEWFYEDLPGFHRVYFIPTDEREFYEMAE